MMNKTLIPCNTDRLPQIDVVRSTIAIKSSVPVDHVQVEIEHGVGVWWCDTRTDSACFCAGFCAE